MLAAMFDPLTDFWLASDGTRLTVMGAACWIMAAVAGLMEWRRGRGRSVAFFDNRSLKNCSQPGGEKLEKCHLQVSAIEHGKHE